MAASTLDDGPLIAWMDGPPRDRRGTYDIISSCAATRVICAWSAVHPDVPKRRTWTSTTGARVFWFLVGVFVPELLLSFAVGQYLQARQISAYAYDTLGFRRPVSRSFWTRLSMALAALCGRKKARRVSGEHKLLTSPGEEEMELANAETETALETGNGNRQHAWTMTHSFFALMGGFARVKPDKFINEGDLAVLQLSSDIPLEAIQDRSKAGALSKAVLCVQIVFFCANCAARANQRLPLSLLEITTIAHSLCALGAYAVWWDKPQDVGGEAPLRDEETVLAYVVNSVGSHYGNDQDSDRLLLRLLLATTAISALYGTPHLLGLHIRFPTPPERALWLLSTILVISCAILTVITLFAAEQAANRHRTKLAYALVVLGSVLLVLYAIGSAFLVCESVRQLFALPDAAFDQPQWTQYIPHFA